MKRIFIFLLCLISFAYGQVTPKASTTFQFGWLDVRSFGAIGDSSTDCTTAIRAALAEAARYRTTLYFPSGNYVVSDTFSVMSGVSIVGAGGNGLTNDVLAFINKSASTNILQRGSNKKTFVVGSNAATPSNTGINFRDINIVYQVAGTPTAGSGIYVYDGGNYTLERVGVRNFYDNVYSSAAAYWVIHSCWITSAAHINLTITNTYNPDFGDMSISDCFFASGQSYVHPYADIYWKSSGGMKITNTKFNVTTLDTTHNKMFGIYFDNTDGGSVDILLSNLSIEGFDSCAIRARCVAGLLHNILIDNVQTYTITNAFDAPINIEYDGTSPGSSNGVMCINNIVANAYVSTVTYPIVQLTRCANVKMGNLINFGYAKLFNLSNCASIAVPIERPVATADQDYVNVNSIEGLDINVASSVTGAVLAPAELRFLNGVIQTGKISGNGELIIGNGPFTSIQSSYPFVQARKDTTADLDMGIYNAKTSGTTTAASIGVKSNGVQALFKATGTTFTPVKTFGASTAGIYAGGNIAILADGGTLSLGNVNSDMFHIQATGRQTGISCTNEAAMFQIGSGSNIVFQTNGAAGQLLAVTGGNTLGDNVTGVSGTVAEYSINAFGINTTTASNTGVTHTSSATLYVAGAPIAGTNVTIPNPYAVKVAAGASYFGGSFQAAGAVLENIVTTAAGSYVILATDFTVVGTGTTSSWTFPTAVTGRRLNLVNHGSGSVTLGTAVTTANGTTSTTLTAGSNYDIQYDGTVWRKIN